MENKKKPEAEPKKKLEKKIEAKKEIKLFVSNIFNKGKELELSTFNKNFIEKIDYFMRRNSYITTILIILTFYHFNTSMDEMHSKIDETLVSNTTYLKKNIGEVIFLSPNGLVISGKKSKVDYSNINFQKYLSNLVINNFLQGLVELSQNFTHKFENSEDIFNKNRKLNNIKSIFFTKDTIDESKYSQLTYQYILENKTPQYIIPLSSSITEYKSSSLDKSFNGDINNGGTYSITVEAKVLSKSWIDSINDYDTFEAKVNISISGVISPLKYANIQNPFGVKITRYSIPIFKKRTARDIGKK